MSRRKHLLLSMLQQEAEPPEKGQHIVRAVGSRGSNIIEVEFPDGRPTLCLLPAKFHKKLWIKKGNYLIIEDYTEAAADGARVTGEILQVLYEDQVKQLRRMPGVWPPEFSDGKGATDAAAAALGGLSLAELPPEESSSGGEEEEEGQPGQQRQQEAAASSSSAAAVGGRSLAAAGPSDRAAAAGGQEEEPEEDGGYSSDDSLPPIEQINNRKIIEYEVTDSDESDDY